MKLVATILASAVASSALVTRQSTCGFFDLNASGGPGGRVGQLDDGQNRIGQTGLPGGRYTIDSNGGLTDSRGRGCILTPPTSQWQCDSGAKPTQGFSISASGLLMYHSSTKFYACPTGDHGGYNIYSTTLAGEPNCVTITLTADNCSGSPPSGAPSSHSKGSAPLPSAPVSKPVPSPPASKPVPSAPGSAPSAPTHSGTPAPKGSCPMNLPSDYQFPHLIIPVNSDQPDRSYGTSFNGTAMGELSSIFDFDIPMSMSGKTCNLEFALPTQDELETSSYFIAGEASFSFFLLSAAATQSTTYGDMAAVTKESLGIYYFGANYLSTIDSFPCPAGRMIAFEMVAVGNSEINYFQDTNPCPIGLYVTSG